MKLTKPIIFLPALLIILLGISSNAWASTLTLSPSSGTITLGQTILVDIMLDTQGVAIDGVDIELLRYDKNVLEVQDVDSSDSGIQISPGVLLPLTINNGVNSSNGTVEFSQVTAGGVTFVGSGKVATITFKGKGTGTSAVTFDFTSGSTSDSNVAGGGGVDTLASVGSGSYTVSPIPTTSGGGGGSSGKPKPTPSPTPTPTPSPVPSVTPPSTGLLFPGVIDLKNKAQVSLLQTVLNKSLGISIKVDGIYGKQSLEAVKYFQSKNGLKVDGIIGAMTRGALNMVNIGVTTTLNPGCTGITGYSTTTGLSCVPTPADSGCTGYNLYSTTTGVLCPSITFTPTPTPTPTTPSPTPVSPTPSPATPGVLFPNVIDLKNRTQVIALQTVLNKSLKTSIRVDGVYGQQTIAAIKYFQSLNGLTVDGIIGTSTREKLNLIK